MEDNADVYLHMRFEAVYDWLMSDVGVKSGRSYAKHWINKNTSKASGHKYSGETFVCVLDVIEDFNKCAYVGKRGFGQTTRNYLGFFVRKLRERMIEMGKFCSRDAQIQYIRENVSRDALYTQLAEECVELAHAALKMTRVYRDKDSSIDQETAAANIVEEFNDILNVMDVLGYNPSGARCVMDAKINRWYERLTNKEK